MWVMTTILILQYVCLVSVLFWWWDREKMIMVGLIVVTSHDVTPRPTEYDATPALVRPGLALEVSVSTNIEHHSQYTQFNTGENLQTIRPNFVYCQDCDCDYSTDCLVKCKLYC